MSEQNRNIANYGKRTALIEESWTGEVHENIAVPMEFRLNKATLSGSLLVEVWRTAEDFNSFNFAEKSPHLSKILPINATIIQNYSALFNEIESQSLIFLGESSDEYNLETIEINLNGLFVSWLARHKEKANRTKIDRTANLAEFEQLKTNYQSIVTSFYGFAFDYMATNSDFSKFK
jgi:hypothetical protein